MTPDGVAMYRLMCHCPPARRVDPACQLLSEVSLIWSTLVTAMLRCYAIIATAMLALRRRGLLVAVPIPGQRRRIIAAPTRSDLGMASCLVK
jgi:hypothetical protein